MEVEYGVNTANKFAFLMDDDHDPEETIAEAAVRAQEEKAAAEARAKKVAKQDSKKPEGKENRGPPVAAEKAPVSQRGGRDSARGARGGRGGRGGQRRPQPVTDDAPVERRETQTHRGDREQHRGGPRGEGLHGRGMNRRGRFDRQSGSDRTGVKAQEKRQGAGKANWGTIADELTGETEQLNVSGEETKEVVVEAAPVDNTMTLAQYKAQQKKEAAPDFNVRKAAMQRPMKEMHTKLDEKADDEVVIVEKRAPKKQMVNIDINFAKTQGDGERGFRGGRGGGRGAGFAGRADRGGFAGRADRGGRGDMRGGREDMRGGRGDMRGGRGRGGGGPRRSEGAQPNVDDLASFPALG